VQERRRPSAGVVGAHLVDDDLRRRSDHIPVRVPDRTIHAGDPPPRVSGAGLEQHAVALADADVEPRAACRIPGGELVARQVLDAHVEGQFTRCTAHGLDPDARGRPEHRSRGVSRPRGAVPEISPSLKLVATPTAVDDGDASERCW
jgi:hypothetical protein